jgi:hypothetical protein
VILGRGTGLVLRIILPAALAAFPLAAQQRIPAAGRVIRLAGTDSIPVSGVRLVLHRVGRTVQGPLDSTLTDAAGRFRFRFAADTTFLFLISANYSGIEYFSPPINTNPALPDTALVVLVSDTSTTQPIHQAARYLVIRRAAEDGSRGVLDLIVLENRGTLTRHSPDTLTPSWVGRIPQGVSGARVGEADLSADAIVIRGDSILVFAPIAPGEKQITLDYALRPGSSLELLFTQESVATNVLSQDRAEISGAEMITADTQTIEGQSFERWAGAPHQGEVLRVRFGGRQGTTPGWILPTLVGLAGAGLLLAFVRLRPRRAGLALERLTDQIAQLEASYAGKEAEVSAVEWQQYQARREQLRSELATLLAARRPPAS